MRSLMRMVQQVDAMSIGVSTAETRAAAERAHEHLQCEANKQYQVPGLPSDEAARLAALRSYIGLEDDVDADMDDDVSERTVSFQHIVELAAMQCDCPIALVSLVEAERQWFKARVGLDATETPRCVSFCAHGIRTPQELFVVEDALEDKRFAGNPLVVGAPHIRFYCGAPLVNKEGFALGTLCVIDRRPRKLDERQMQSLRLLAVLAVDQLELHRALWRRTAETRMSNWLLDVVMPPPVAMRLKAAPEELIADTHRGVTVLFVDIIGFTQLSSTMSAERLVRRLSMLFSVWDELVARHSLWKIKSIGDAFLVCGGLPLDAHALTLSSSKRKRRHSVAAAAPASFRRGVSAADVEPRRGNSVELNVRSDVELMRSGAQSCVLFALDVIRAVECYNRLSHESFRVRIGVNTGVVVAGVLGSTSIAYDVFGDAVNVASRLEGQAAPNGIVVSESTYQLVHELPEVVVESKAVRSLKGKGEVTCYNLRGGTAGTSSDDGESDMQVESAPVGNFGDRCIAESDLTTLVSTVMQRDSSLTESGEELRKEISKQLSK